MRTAKPTNKILYRLALFSFSILLTLNIRSENLVETLAYHKQDQIISFTISPKTYGDPDFTLTASSNSTNPIYFESSDESIIQINGNIASIIGAGEVCLFAKQDETVDFNSGSKKVVINVQKALLSIGVINKTREYGDENPSFDLQYSGFKNGDTESSLDDIPEPFINADETSSVGNYTVFLSGGADSNYDFSKNNGLLTITKAPLSAIAEDKEKFYGDSNPKLTVRYVGFKLDDTPSVLDNPPFPFTSVNETTNVGEYSIFLTESFDNNYEISNSNGSLTVRKVELTITVNDAEKKYGEDLPSLPYEITGFKNSESESVIDQLPSIQTNISNLTPVGDYVINASAGLDNNYSFDYTPGNFSVNKADLIVSVQNASKEYGEPNPDFSYLISGYVLNEDQSVLDELPIFELTVDQFSAVGTYEVAAKDGFDNNYSFIYEPGFFTVSKAPLEVNPVSNSIVYGGEIPDLELEYTGFKGDDTVDDLDFIPTAEIAQTTLFPKVGTYVLNVNVGFDNNYEIIATEGEFNIEKAVLEIEIEDAVKEYGEENPVFEYEIVGFAEGESENNLQEPLNIVTEAARFSEVGTYEINVSDFADLNYELEIIKGELTIEPALLLVEAPDIEVEYGDELPEFDLIYTGFKGEDSEISLDEIPAISVNADKESSPGDYEIILQGGQDENYDFELVDGNLKINKAPLTIAAKSFVLIYGDEIPELEYNVDGLKNNEDISVIDALPQIEIITDQNLDRFNSGIYDIQLRGGIDDNYEINLGDGKLTIEKALLQVKVLSSERIYGDTNPDFTVSATGFKYDEQLGDLDSKIEISSTAMPNSDVGVYEIIGESGEDKNYDIIISNGFLTIEKARLTVTVMDAEKEYGEENPEFEIKIEGFKLNDTEDDLDELPVASVTSTIESEAGNYPIILSGGIDNNYDFTRFSGNLMITKAPLKISAMDLVKIYGQENPEFIIKYEGFKNSDTENELDELPSVNTNATIESSAGEYTLDLMGGRDRNYEFEREDGILTINKSKLFAKARDTSRPYGESNPEFLVDYTGFKFDDNISDLDLRPVGFTSATSTSNVGQYRIELTQGIDRNYEIEAIFGSLTIVKADQEIVFEALPDTVLFENISIPLVAYSTSGLPVNIILDNEKVGFIEDDELIFLEPGKVKIQVTQSGNDNFNAAEPVSQELTVVAEMEEEEALSVIEKPDLKIYPNPTANFFQVEIQSSAVQSDTSIELYGMGGKMLMSKSISIGSLVDVSHLKEGNYLVIIKQNDASYSKILIKN